MSHLVRAKHIATILGLDAEKTQIIDYSYCRSVEELDFALFCDFLREGLSESEAQERASYFAAIMWDRR